MCDEAMGGGHFGRQVVEDVDEGEQDEQEVHLCLAQDEQGFIKIGT